MAINTNLIVEVVVPVLVKGFDIEEKSCKEIRDSSSKGRQSKLTCTIANDSKLCPTIARIITRTSLS